MNYRLKTFGDQNLSSKEVRDISSLHSELLPHSPVVLMGPDFMEKFYYKSLIEGKLVCGAVAYIDEDPAGFIVATNDPEGFMSTALRRHWLLCLVSIVTSIIRKAKRIMAMKEAYQIQRHVGEQRFEKGMCEMLSFGVKKKYRVRKFVKESQHQISIDLLNIAVKQLKGRGGRSARAVVDQDNLEAKMFYYGNGWRVGSPYVGGWKVPTIEFVLDLT